MKSFSHFVRMLPLVQNGAKCKKMRNVKKVAGNTLLYTFIFTFWEHFVLFRDKCIASLRDDNFMVIEKS